mmetsp:Transcript_7702/g.26041  ORF Transcript_7702/g.26041 Transcript_7702/m.26041 type:complete len:211 (-) Transcript_7702:109-741(-)
MTGLLQFSLFISLFCSAFSFSVSPSTLNSPRLEASAVKSMFCEKVASRHGSSRASGVCVQHMKPERLKEEVAGFVTSGEMNIEDLLRETDSDLKISETDLKKLRALRLQREAQDAINEAKAARHRADIMKQKLPKEDRPFSNGLSDRLSPLSMQMHQQSFEYLSKCPIRELRAALEETRCVLFQKIASIEPRDLLILAIVFYLISVLQLQ